MITHPTHSFPHAHWYKDQQQDPYHCALSNHCTRSVVPYSLQVLITGVNLTKLSTATSSPSPIPIPHTNTHTHAAHTHFTKTHTQTAECSHTPNHPQHLKSYYSVPFVNHRWWNGSSLQRLTDLPVQQQRQAEVNLRVNKVTPQSKVRARRTNLGRSET